jgi:hypothetical protein
MHCRARGARQCARTRSRQWRSARCRGYIAQRTSDAAFTAVCLADDLARGPQLAGQPAQGIGLQRVHGNRYFFEAMAGAALETPQLKATLTRRNPRQAHPVLASGAHRPLRTGTQDTHPRNSGLDDKIARVLQSVRYRTHEENFIFSGYPGALGDCEKPIAAELLLVNMAAGRSGASCPRAAAMTTISSRVISRMALLSQTCRRL